MGPSLTRLVSLLEDEIRTQEDDGHLTTEAEVGVMRPQARSCQALLATPEATGRKQRVSPTGFRGRAVPWTPESRTSGLQTIRF